MVVGMLISVILQIGSVICWDIAVFLTVVMERDFARGIAAEILMVFFLKNHKIEAESPARRARPFFIV